MLKYFYVVMERVHRLLFLVHLVCQSLFYGYGYFVGKKSFSIEYMLGQITVLKNPILTLTHKTAHCTYGQVCNLRVLSHYVKPQLKSYSMGGLLN